MCTILAHVASIMHLKIEFALPSHQLWANSGQVLNPFGHELAFSRHLLLGGEYNSVNGALRLVSTNYLSHDYGYSTTCHENK